MADVAQAAGVSTATASRALGDMPAVSDAMRMRVRTAARSLGYERSSGRRLKSTQILILIPRLGSPFFTPFLEAVTDLVSEAGYCVTVGDFHGSRRKEEHFARALRDETFAGAILFTGKVPSKAEAASHQPISVPMVLACNEIKGNALLPVFDVDDRKAASQMVAYLIDLGHRKIAHIRGPRANVEAEERLQGYVAALAAGGIAFDSDLVWDGDFYLRSGAAAAGRFLASAERPTAVFSSNDQMAMGFITEIKAAGFNVPRDVSVAGFDDIEYSTIFEPPLTTMRQPREEIGRLAAIELLRRLGDNKTAISKPRRVRLECEMVLRSSTQALRMAVEQREKEPAIETRGVRNNRRPRRRTEHLDGLKGL